MFDSFKSKKALFSASKKQFEVRANAFDALITQLSQIQKEGQADFVKKNFLPFLKESKRDIRLATIYAKKLTDDHTNLDALLALATKQILVLEELFHEHADDSKLVELLQEQQALLQQQIVVPEMNTKKPTIFRILLATIMLTATMATAQVESSSPAKQNRTSIELIQRVITVHPVTIVCLANRLNLRDAPTTKSNVITVSTSGERMVCTGYMESETGRWLRVTYKDKTFYIAQTYKGKLYAEREDVLQAGFADFTKRFEGFRNKRYKDTRGKMTIGYGTNLDALSDVGRAVFVKWGYDPKRLRNEDITIPEKVAWSVLQADLIEAEKDAKNSVKNFYLHPPKVRAIIVDMRYNLGKAGFNDFKKLRAALENTNYIEAAREMERSDWFKQVKNRSRDHVKTLRDQAQS
ncbi:MAG: lysozyme [Candidatus Woesearchaeota archaeon]|jgi:lysozyme